jgi:hypothetical protein
MSDIKFPFGDADVQAMTETGAQALTITDNLTILDGVTVEATGNRRINLTVDAEVPVGAMLLVRNQTNGTETLTFGTGITAPVQTGVAGTIHNQLFMYNGTVFEATSADQQIN